MHKHALASPHPGRAVQKLVRGRPAQDQRSRLRRVDAHRHAGHVVRLKRAIVGVRPDHCHVGHAVATLKVAHAIADLIDLPDDIVAHDKRWPEAHRLRVHVATDQHLGVIEARGEHTDPHLAPASGWQGGVDHLQPVGTAEVAHSNNTIARLYHGRSCNLVIQRPDTLLQLLCRRCHRHAGKNSNLKC